MIFDQFFTRRYTFKLFAYAYILCTVLVVNHPTSTSSIVIVDDLMHTVTGAHESIVSLLLLENDILEKCDDRTIGRTDG